jgi:transcriptional regulator with XRE-family HTH domain
MPLVKPSTIGPAIKSLREAASMTQTELATRLGVSRSRVFFLEKRASKTTPDLMRRLARALGVSVAELRLAAFSEGQSCPAE